MAKKDFTKALKLGAEKETKQEAPEEKKPHIFYGGDAHIEYENGEYLYVLDDTEELRTLQEQDIIIDTPQYTQEELKEKYLIQEALKNKKAIDKTEDEARAEVYAKATQKLATIKEDPKKGSFTFKASKEVLDDLRALATIKKMTQAEIIEDALIEYYKSHLFEYDKALDLRKLFDL